MMVTKSDPSLSSLAESMDYEAVGKIEINKLGKILFEVLENGDNTVDLEAVEGGYQQYMHIRLNHVVKTYNQDTDSFDV